MRKILLAAALMSGALLAADHLLAAQPAKPDITIENFTFKPATLSVRAGTAVTFKNGDDIPHSVVAADGSFHSKALDTDDTFTITFSTPGEIAYFCGLHPHMQGHISVTP